MEVSIPRQIRFLFGNGKAPSRRKGTGTSDKLLAETKVQQLCHQIYQEFDTAQNDYEKEKSKEVDNFAKEVITKLAAEFNYNRGDLPRLHKTTGYDSLQKMKAELDAYAGLMKNKSPAPDKLKVAVSRLGSDIKDGVTVEDAVQNFKEVIGNTGPFTMKQNGLLARHDTAVVQSFWQDLLTEAAIYERKPAPTFEASNTIEIAKFGSQFVPAAISANEATKRPRRIEPISAKRISALREEYVGLIERDYSKQNTKLKLIRGVDQFIKLMEDPPLQSIKAKTVYDYIDRQLEIRKDASNKTLSNYHWGISKFLNHCVRRGYIEVNPFLGQSIAEFGKKTINWQPFTRHDLHQIFKHDWHKQERLLLSILVTTGMRLTEAASLTWERFNDTEHQGIRYFSLIDTGDEEVATKNTGSSRHIPLHPTLILPAKSTGRLFDYKIDNDKLASTSAGEGINPIIARIVNHDKKRVHSFRRTLKILLRDADVPKEINDYYAGHGQVDVAPKAYGGVSIQKRYDALCKVQHPWLNETQTPCPPR